MKESPKADAPGNCSCFLAELEEKCWSWAEPGAQQPGAQQPCLRILCPQCRVTPLRGCCPLSWQAHSLEGRSFSIQASVSSREVIQIYLATRAGCLSSLWILLRWI